jgi:hypothetical protein
VIFPERGRASPLPAPRPTAGGRRLGEASDVRESRREEMQAGMRELLGQFDGSRAARVAMLAGMTREELEAAGGVEEDERLATPRRARPQADAGRVLFEGQDLAALGQKELRALRRHMQMIFHNPLASLNPQMTIGAAIGDAMIIQKIGGSAAARQAYEATHGTKGAQPGAGRDQVRRGTLGVSPEE